MLARDVLWYITFIGFGINYMQRIHINIIIVGMIKHNQNKNSEYLLTLNDTLLNASNNSNSTTLGQILQNGNNSLSELVNNETLEQVEAETEAERFDWDEKIQNQILGSFFWIHWLTQIPGGILARKYGTKAIFGYSNFVPSLLTLLLPIAAYTNVNLLIFIRIVQGFIMGASWPSMHHLTAQWIPPNERSKFISSYLGSSIGIAFTYPFCGFLMDKFGWESAFYATGVLGVIWFVCWWLIVYDSPSVHPRISEKEKEYIQSQLSQTVAKRELPVPWKDILLSLPLWMVVIAQLGNVWGFYTLMTQAPTFFKVILHLNIKKTGVFSGLPQLAKWGFSLAWAYVSDYLLQREILDRTNVRKLATFFCTIVQGLMIIGISFSGNNSTAALLYMIAAAGVGGGVASGPLACVVDLSPNFASILLGIVGMIANAPGVLSPIVVGYLTYQNQTYEQWQKVFYITSGITITGGLLYISFGKSSVQSWNNVPTDLPEEAKRLNEEKNGKEMKDMSVIIPSLNEK